MQIFKCVNQKFVEHLQLQFNLLQSFLKLLNLLIFSFFAFFVHVFITNFIKTTQIFNQGRINWLWFWYHNSSPIQSDFWVVESINIFKEELQLMIKEVKKIIGNNVWEELQFFSRHPGRIMDSQEEYSPLKSRLTYVNRLGMSFQSFNFQYQSSAILTNY